MNNLKRIPETILLDHPAEHAGGAPIGKKSQVHPDNKANEHDLSEQPAAPQRLTDGSHNPCFGFHQISMELLIIDGIKLCRIPV